MTIHEYNPTIYPIKLWVIESPSSDINNKFKYLKTDSDYLYKIKDQFIASTSGIVYNVETDKFGIIITLDDIDDLTPGMMAHEACHAAGEIYNHLGEDTIPFESEANAYFVQWIVTCINETKNRITMKAKAPVKKAPAKPATKAMPSYKKGSAKC